MGAPSFTTVSSRMPMALPGTGQTSSQTRQFTSSLKTTHSFSSIRALPMGVRCFSASVCSGMAKFGHTVWQTWQK
jgi:hypothetical protein